MVNSMILNLPYFRDDQSIVTIEKFSEIADEDLTKVNKKLEALNYHPKKLRLKYSKIINYIQVTTMYIINKIGSWAWAYDDLNKGVSL
jgi:hypothetical protein